MIKKQKQYFFKRNHYAIVDENDVVLAIKILSTYTRVPGEKRIFIRNAGWEHRPERYFISFVAYNREWDTINKDLCTKIPNIEILR